MILLLKNNDVDNKNKYELEFTHQQRWFLIQTVEKQSNMAKNHSPIKMF